ncbi:hypothetical protein FZC78_02515 [Rossellomorea vietnamensis]|uniref:Uncharacterized protein n=1 Tax=Rossellomorea vietnamensis TaxID=218284 RepID=A0A5D4P2G6_9BACI|nr:hypothetical protein [Rossellomorea vietnamensis]TYS19916.1 hypothetical protein FZC78_02515 [Rossellomorea vietnamensis]
MERRYVPREARWVHELMLLGEDMYPEGRGGYMVGEIYSKDMYRGEKQGYLFPKEDVFFSSIQ